MIDINLIPLNQRKRLAGLVGLELNIPREIIFGVGVAAIIVLLIVHAVLGFFWIGKRASLAKLEQEWSRILPDKKAIDEITENTKVINKKTKEVEDFIVKRTTTWSHKLNIISNSLPKGVWLSKLTLDEKSIILQGVAVSKQRNEIVLVDNFINDIRKSKEFSTDFSNIEINAINKAKFNGLDVSQFTVTAKLKEHVVSLKKDSPKKSK